MRITYTPDEAGHSLPSYVVSGWHEQAARALHSADANSVAKWADLPPEERAEYHVRVTRALDPKYGSIQIDDTGLEEAIAAALRETDLVPGKMVVGGAEVLVYSRAIQGWLRSHGALEHAVAQEKGQDARGPREPLRVECQVAVPLTTPHAAADVLSRIPINADVHPDTQQSLIARWTEER